MGEVFEDAGIPGLASAEDVDAALSRLRNMLAEMAGLYQALRAVPEDSDVTIVHDYEGVGAFVRGNWSPKDPVVGEVVAAARSLIDRRGLHVQFLHQHGHRSTSAGRHDFARFDAVADALADRRALARSTGRGCRTVQLPLTRARTRSRSGTQDADPRTSRVSNRSHGSRA